MPPSSRQRDCDLADDLGAPLLDSDQDSAGSAPRPRPALHVVRGSDHAQPAPPQPQRPGLVSCRHAQGTAGASGSAGCDPVQCGSDIDRRCLNAGPGGYVLFDPRPRKQTVRTVKGRAA